MQYREILILLNNCGPMPIKKGFYSNPCI